MNTLNNRGKNFEALQWDERMNRFFQKIYKKSTKKVVFHLAKVMLLQEDKNSRTFFLP